MYDAVADYATQWGVSLFFAVGTQGSFGTVLTTFVSCVLLACGHGRPYILLNSTEYTLSSGADIPEFV